MPKTNMASHQRVLFLGIILLFTGHFVNSSPANIPVKDVKEREQADTDHVGNEIKKNVEPRQEERTSKLAVYSTR